MCPECEAPVEYVCTLKEGEVQSCVKCGYEVVVRDGEIVGHPNYAAPVIRPTPSRYVKPALSQPRDPAQEIGVVEGMAIIGKRWLTSKELADVRRELYFENEKKQTTLVLYNEDDGSLVVPRAYALKKFGERAFADQTSDGSQVDFRFKKQLRGDQPRIVQEILTKAKQPRGGIAQAPCGSGKTVMGLYAASEWKKTTLVLVHTEFLADQWIERALEFTDIEPHEIGRVQGDRCEFHGKKLVLGMVESISAACLGKRVDYPEEFYQWPGVVILDEVHRHAADTWHLAIGRFPAGVRLGLSATPERGDNMEDVIFSHVGPLVSTSDVYTVKPQVFIVHHDIAMDMSRFQQWWRGRPTGEINLAKVVTALSEHEGRNKMLTSYLLNALSGGRKVLVLSDRLEQLDVLMGMVNEKTNSQFKLGKYIGGMKREGRDASAKCQGVFGTYALAAEGLDIPDLDTLFLATPRTNVEQSVGRILRDWQGKKTPFVVDPADSPEICVALSRKRMRFYSEHGWPITEKTWVST